MRAKDIIEVPTVRGLCYLQVTPYKYRIYGKLLRVFEGYWETRPDSISSEIFKTKHLICCPFIRNALIDGKLQKVGRIDLIDDTGQCPPMRGAPNEEGGWYMWGADTEHGGRYMIALKEHAALSATIGYSVSSMVNLLDLDWRPEIDLWTQVAVDRNQRRLADASEEEIEELKEEEFL